jgi:hypothetical protein
MPQPQLPIAKPISNFMPQPQLPISNVMPQLQLPIANEKKHLANISPIDIILEQTCRYGQRCSNINNPLRCGRNHIVIGTPCYSGEFFGNKINKGDVIPQEFCKDEIIWEKSRCHNIYCTYLHGSGRVRYLENFKSKSSNETYNNIERKRKQEDVSSNGDVNAKKVDLDAMLDSYHKKQSISREPSPKQNPPREENKLTSYTPHIIPPKQNPPREENKLTSYTPYIPYSQAYPPLPPPPPPAFSSYYYPYLYPPNGFQKQ